METLGWIILIALTTCNGWAQSDPTMPGLSRPGTSALSADPVFNQILSRRVTYPIAAIRSSTYGRIYAGFDIDEKGHVGNIVILSPVNTGVGFEYEIKAALKHMPPLNPRYAGRYALPVSFVLTSWQDGSQTHIPDNKVTNQALADRRLLGEVVFKASIRHTSTYVPPSRQIVYY